MARTGPSSHEPVPDEPSTEFPEPAEHAELEISAGPAQRARGRVPPDQADLLITTFGILASAVAGIGGAVFTRDIAATQDLRAVVPRRRPEPEPARRRMVRRLCGRVRSSQDRSRHTAFHPYPGGRPYVCSYLSGQPLQPDVTKAARSESPPCRCPG